MNTVYEFFRGGSGFALVLVGIAWLLTPKLHSVYRFFGWLFICVGCLFTLSILDPVLNLPDDFTSFLTVAFIYVLSQSLFQIALFVFGGERKPGRARTVWVVGAVWTLVIGLVPFLDYVLPQAGSLLNLESGRPLQWFHGAVSGAQYLWPIAILGGSLTMSRWTLRDLPGKSRFLWPLIVGLGIILVSLSLAVGAVIFSSVDLYRAAHTLLELGVLSWYLYLIRHPKALFEFRAEVQSESQKHSQINPSEAQIVSSRIQGLVETEAIHRDPRMSLSFLAKRVRIPAYQLSRYFNQVKKCSFSEWINQLRMDEVGRQLAKNPDSRILDLAHAAGYSSKGIFNAQFRRIHGVTPTEYRKRLLEKRGKSR